MKPVLQLLFVLLAVNPCIASEPPITSVVFVPSGDAIVVGSQSGLQITSWPELKLQKSLKPAALNLHDLAFSPSGEKLAIAGGTPGEEGSVEILSWPDGTSLNVLEASTDSVMSVVWINDASLAAASLDHSITLWDVELDKPTKTLAGHSRGVSSLAFLPQKNLLVSAGIDQSLRVWNLAAGELIHSLNIHTQPVHDLALRPIDQGLPMVASASEDRTVRLWQPTIGRMVRFARLPAKPLDVQWLADGSKIVATCTDGHVRVIDPVAVEVTKDVRVMDGWCYALAIHPTDKSIVVGGSDGILKRISIETQ